MTGLAPILLCAAASYLLRIALVVLVPAERLPARAVRALDHLAPAALASLVALELTGLVTGTGTDPRTAAALLAATAAIAATARLTRSLPLCTLLSLAAIAAVDLL